MTNGAASIGAQGPDSFTGSDSCGATAGGAAGNTLQIPGVMGGTIIGGLSGGAHGELVHIGLAQENGFILAQVFNNMSIINGHYIAQHFRGAGSQ